MRGCGRHRGRVVDPLVLAVEGLGVDQAAVEVADRRRLVGEAVPIGDQRVARGIRVTVGTVENTVRLCHVLACRRRGDVALARNDARVVVGDVVVRADHQVLDVLTRRPGCGRNQHRRRHRLEAAVCHLRRGPGERPGLGERDAVAGDVNGPCPEPVSASEPERRQGARRGGVVDLELKVAVGRVRGIGLEPVRRHVRQVLAGTGADEAPPRPAHQVLRHVHRRVRRPARAGALGSRGLDPTLVALRNRHDSRRRSDPVTAEPGVLRGSPRTELEPPALRL